MRSRLQSLAPDASLRALQRRPEGIESAMDLVFAIQRETQARCGPPEGENRVLLLLGGAREGEG
jgi:hypothetical protein